MNFRVLYICLQSMQCLQRAAQASDFSSVHLLIYFIACYLFYFLFILFYLPISRFLPFWLLLIEINLVSWQFWDCQNWWPYWILEFQPIDSWSWRTKQHLWIVRPIYLAWNVCGILERGTLLHSLQFISERAASPQGRANRYKQRT